MENDNNGNPNPENGNAENELDGLDSDALKEKLLSERNKFAEVEGKNRQLFERLKKEQGFERDPDDPTNWIKHEKEVKAKKSESKPEPTEEFGLLQKTYLRAVGVSEEDEIELARDIQKKTGLEWDKLVEDDYFKMKLEKLRNGKANAQATDIKSRGGTGPSNAKNTPEYWIQKGELPNPDDVPDRHTRAKIVRAMKQKEENAGGTYYNE